MGEAHRAQTGMGGHPPGAECLPMGGVSLSGRGLTALGATAVGLAIAGMALPAGTLLLWTLNLSFTLASLFAVVALHSAARRIANPEQRRPWLYLRAACAFWLAGQISWDAANAAGVVVPFPWVSDVAWLLFAPIALAGVYRLAPASSGEKLIALFDALAVAVAVGAVVTAFYFDEASVSTLSGLAIGVALSYGVLHSAMAATIVQAIVTRRALLGRPELLVLSVGLLIEGVAFSVWAGQLLTGTYVAGTFVDLLWTVGLVAIGAGGLLAVDGAPIPAATERDIRIRNALPSLASLVLVVLVVVAVRTEQPYRERYLLFGALVITLVFFVARSWLASAEYARLIERERLATDRGNRFFTLAPEMFAISQGDRFVRVNHRFSEVLGYGEEELLAGSFLDIVHPDDVEATRAELARLERGMVTLAFESRHRRKDGAYAWLLWNARPDPVSGLVYAAAQDITARKQAEAALRESEERFTELVTTIPEVFFIADAHLGGTLYVSPAYETIWGHTVESLRDDPLSWLEAVHEDDRARVLAGLERVNEDGRVEHEFRVVRPDGEVRLVKEVVTLIRNEDGVPIRHVGFGSDITEQRELEQELQHSRRLDAIGRLAGGVAHDFNNILTGVAGYAELALGRGDVRGGLRNDLEEILGGARRASELTRQLLTFARRQVVQPTIVDLNDLIEGVNGFLRGAIREDVVVTTELGARLPRVKADPQQLEQVLMNLVLNARDAMPDGGMLTISTRALGPGEVALAVADTGVGMSDQVLSRLFEPFFTTKDVGKGTGLGLATAYGIVEDCGGRISVESSLGEGSVFTVVLPVTDAVRAEAAGPALEPCLGGCERILFVEDDDLVRRLTHEMLEREGYSVTVCETPLEALEYEGEWDLLLTDVVMPALNGPQLALRLAETRPPFRVLFTSGYSGDTMIEEGALDPDMALLQKPFSRDELTRRVREALDGPVGVRPLRQPARA